MPAEQIVIRPDLRIGSTTYLPGDKLNIQGLLSRGALNEASITALKGQGYYADLTPETLSICLARRPAGSPAVPRGFTTEELVEIGVVAPPEPPRVEAPPPVGAKPKPEPTVRPDRFPRTAQSIDYRGYVLTPRPRGGPKSQIPPLWEATMSDGTPLRDRGFKSQDGARKFIDGLVESDQTPAESEAA